MNKISFKKPIMWNIGKWVLLLAVVLVIYFNGWQTQISGRLQQAVLWTGLIQPDTHLATDKKVKVDYDMPLVSLDGKKTTLSALKGKVIFLNFWATWCPPCLAELPNIQALYKKYKNNDDVRFVMVSLDKNSNKARTFIAHKEYTFPAYQLANRRPSVFQSQTIPMTYIIGRNGVLVAKRKGMANYNTQKFCSFLKRLADI